MVGYIDRSHGPCAWLVGKEVHLTAALLVLLLLLFLLFFGQIARSDYLGLDCLGSLRPVRRDALRHEHTHRPLISLVFGILSSSDQLSQPRGGLEKKDKEGRSNTGPVIERLGSKTAPLVQNQPNALLSSKVRVPAVSPKPSCDKAPIEVCLLPTARHLGGLLVFLLCVLEN